jgi:hypothetical protein
VLRRRDLPSFVPRLLAGRDMHAVRRSERAVLHGSMQCELDVLGRHLRRMRRDERAVLPGRDLQRRAGLLSGDSRFERNVVPAAPPPPCGGRGQVCCDGSRCGSGLQCKPVSVTVGGHRLTTFKCE